MDCLTCLLAVALCALSLCTTAQAAPLPSSKAVVAALQPFVDSHSLVGAVTLIADKDHIISLDGVGWADIAAHKPMTTGYAGNGDHAQGEFNKAVEEVLRDRAVQQGGGK